MDSSSLSSSVKLKIAGAWSGVLEVQLDSWTRPMLRDEVKRRSGATDDCTVNLICRGRVLKECCDDDGGAPALVQLGLGHNSKVLATIVSPDKGKALDQELASEAERSDRLTRLKAAAVALAERHSLNGALPLEDFNMELEDQSGQKINLGSETDQRGAMMGLLLHAKGKSLINKQKCKDALEVLYIAEEAFSLCDPKLHEMIDNVPMLQLDIVWLYFMLRDISCLSVAGIRLSKARKGFERSHGKDSSRFRILQEGRHAELAIYLRLELLEGVIAYHSGNQEESRKALNSAQAKFNQLQVPDESLSMLMNMGYKEESAKRALRMTGHDIQNAAEFLVEERENKIRRVEEDTKRKKEIMEQKKYGTTPTGKAVHIGRLNELVAIGFERNLAAEALRLNENDTQLALDLLTDPDKNCNLQRKIELRKKCVAAPASVPPVAVAVAAADNEENEDDEVQEGSSSRAAAAAAAESTGRDVEMENELAHELTGDPIADYDIEATKEGEAIAEYLSLLDSLHIKTT